MWVMFSQQLSFMGDLMGGHMPGEDRARGKSGAKQWMRLLFLCSGLHSSHAEVKGLHTHTHNSTLYLAKQEAPSQFKDKFHLN